MPGLGGPLFSDAFGRRRSPTPRELIECYKSIVFAAVNLNAHGVATGAAPALCHDRAR